MACMFANQDFIQGGGRFMSSSFDWSVRTDTLVAVVGVDDMMKCAS